MRLPVAIRPAPSSAPLARDVSPEFEATFGVPVIEAYGMTEAAHQMTRNPLPPAVRKPGRWAAPAGPGGDGLGRRGQPALAWRGGRSLIRGANVTPGYEQRRREPEAFRMGGSTLAIGGGWTPTATCS